MKKLQGNYSEAKIINLPLNNATPSFDAIDRNWHDLTKKDDKEVSEKLKRVMNIVKYLVSSKEYKKFTYPYFIVPLVVETSIF